MKSLTVINTIYGLTKVCSKKCQVSESKNETKEAEMSREWEEMSYLLLSTYHLLDEDYLDKHMVKIHECKINVINLPFHN